MSDFKKPRMDNKSNKKKYYSKPSGSNFKSRFLAVGQTGFLATCNFREKECVRELYRILNRYSCAEADETQSNLPGDIAEKVDPGAKEVEVKDEPSKSDESDDNEEEDISSTLEKDIDISKTKHDQHGKQFKFQTVSTGATNCVFITSSMENTVELGVRIIEDLHRTKQSLTKNVLRFIPIEVVCKANIKDIVDAAGILFDKYFLHGERTFSIVYNKRYNNDIKRDDIIKELAELIVAKNMKNKVDLKEPEFSVIVEIIKGLCCLSVIPYYIKYRKYNLTELCSQ